MSDGVQGSGVVLTFGGTMTTPILTGTSIIGNIVTVSKGGGGRDAIDKSTADSTGKAREFLAGMIDAGELTCNVNLDATALGNANSLEAVYASGEVAAIKVVIPASSASTSLTAASFLCLGFVQNLGAEIPYDDKMMQPVTFKLTGVPTFTDEVA